MPIMPQTKVEFLEVDNRRMEALLSQAHDNLTRLYIPSGREEKKQLEDSLAEIRRVVTNITYAIWPAIIEHQKTEYILAPNCTKDKPLGIWGLTVHHPDATIIRRPPASERPQYLQGMVEWKCPHCNLIWACDEQEQTRENTARLDNFPTVETPAALSQDAPG